MEEGMFQCQICNFTKKDFQEVLQHMEQHESSQDCDLASTESSGPGTSFIWNDIETKLLIEQYRQLKPQVENGQIKNWKEMWGQVASVFEQNGYTCTIIQLQNKWKSLLRSYKSMLDNRKKTGRGRKYCPYQRELEDIVGKIHPEFVINASSSSSTIPSGSTSTLPGSSTVTPGSSNTVGPSSSLIIDDLYKNTQSNRARKRRNTAALKELQLLRAAIEEKTKKREEMDNKKLEMQAQLIEEMKKKNNILSEILKKL